MKKVLLSSVVALTLFAAAAPVFSADEATDAARKNDGAYYLQTQFTNADKVNEYLAQHDGEIRAEAAADPAVVAAKAALDAVEGGSHNYGEVKAAYEAAFNNAFNAVRNKYVQQFQATYNNATEQEGKTYIQGETPEQANARYLKEHGINPEQANADAAKADAAKADAAKELLLLLLLKKKLKNQKLLLKTQVKLLVKHFQKLQQLNNSLLILM